MSGPTLDEKLARPKTTGGTRAQCTTEQLKNRFGVWISEDGKEAKVTSMLISKWKKIATDTWEKVE